MRALALAIMAIVFADPSGADDERCWPIQMAEVQGQFCDHENRWVQWSENREPAFAEIPLAYGWTFKERHGATIALLRPSTIVYENKKATLPFYERPILERPILELLLIGTALGFSTANVHERVDSSYEGWHVPATTTVFQFDGEDDPTVFVTHARRDDSVLNVYTIVPRQLTEEEIARHLAGTHADVLDGAELQRLGSWSSPE